MLYKVPRHLGQAKLGVARERGHKRLIAVLWVVPLALLNQLGGARLAVQESVRGMRALHRQRAHV